MSSHFVVYSSATVTPMERAVPLTMLIAASMLPAFRSGILVVAISRTWAWVSWPTLVLFGTVRIHGDDDRDDQAFLMRGAGVEILAESGDVHAGLAQSGTNGGRGGCLCGRDLQLDDGGNFLCHVIWHLLQTCGIGGRGAACLPPGEKR